MLNFSYVYINIDHSFHIINSSLQNLWQMLNLNQILQFVYMKKENYELRNFFILDDQW